MNLCFQVIFYVELIFPLHIATLHTIIKVAYKHVMIRDIVIVQDLVK